MKQQEPTEQMVIMFLALVISGYSITQYLILGANNSSERSIKGHRTMGKIYLPGILLWGVSGLYLLLKKLTNA